MTSSQDSVPSSSIFNRINKRIVSTDYLNNFDVSLADSSLFVYPTFMHSDKHTFDTWNKPFMKIMKDYSTALFFWILNQVGRLTGMYLGRPLIYREKINFREFRAWLFTLIAWIVSFICIPCVYLNDDQLFDLLGSPYYRMGKPEVVYVCIGLGALNVALIKTLALMKERNHEVKAVRIMEQIMSPSKGSLDHRYLNKFMLRINPFITISFYVPWIAILLYGIVHIVYTIEILSDENSNRENYYFNHLGLNRYFNLFYWKIFSFTLLGILAIIFVWYTAATFICIFTIYYATQKYLEYRFRQSTIGFKLETMRKRIRFEKVMLIIKQHDRIVVLNKKNNSFMSLILFVVYFCLTPLVDLAFYQSFYLGANWFTQFFFTITALCGSFLLYFFAFSSACLYISAHSLYKPLNSLIAQSKGIPRKKLLAICFYVERFSGPAITTWCWNLFALTSYQFYIFMAGIVSNFFLIVSLIGK